MCWLSIAPVARASRWRREAIWGYAFISPWLVGFLIFTLLPMLATIAFSLTDMRLEFSETQFVGMRNYRNLLADGQAWESMKWTLVYGAVALPVIILLPLGIALLMNHRALAGKTAFRAGFYFPYIIPFVAAIFFPFRSATEAISEFAGTTSAVHSGLE